jgi:plasmid stabilization system protein ParE
MIRVVVTETAKADISTIIDDLEQKAGARTAEAYARAVADALVRLAVHPAIGPPRADLGAFTRMIVLRPYLLMYRYEPGADSLIVMRMLHGRRDISADLLFSGT